MCKLFGLGSLLVSCLLATPVLADGNHGAVQEGGRFTPNKSGAVFPPQPRSITNVRQYKPVAPIAARSRNSMFVDILADTDVARLLGDRYALLGSREVKDKWTGDNPRHDVTFFSHSWNQTVRVRYLEGTVDNIDVIPAADDQPPLSEPEQGHAIALARAYWLEQGNALVNTLIGYAIQTFQDDGSPFPVRMAYVSFHVESPEPPLLMNWVDLTTQQVVRSEVEQ